MPLKEDSWLRWLVPPVRDLIFVVLLVSLTFGTLAQRLIRDGGTGWHIRTGQRILSTHSVPREDPFSLSTAGKPWYAWEWLYDVGLGVIYNHAGLNGAVAATGLLIAATFAWLFEIMRRRGADLFTALVLLMLSLSASAIHLYVRPHVVSWFLTLAFWLLLESAREPDDASRLIWLPLLVLFWVNVHGGFLFGLAVLFVYDLEALWRVMGPNENSAAARWLRGLSLATLASVLATFLNPYGYKLHVHVFQYLTDKFLMQHIEEFKPAGFHNLSQQCFLFLLVLAVAGLLRARGKPCLRDSLMLLLAALSGMYASRNLPVSSLLVAAVAAPSVSKAFVERLFEKSRGRNLIEGLSERDADFTGGPWAWAAIVGVLAITLSGGRLGSAQLMDAHFDPSRFPVGAVDYLEAHGIHAPIFNPDQWGGYLIYRNYPGVLVDDRHDLYGDEFFKQYLNIVHLEPGWPDALDRTSAQLVLMPTNGRLVSALRAAPRWKEEYQDATATLFKREP